MGCESSKGQLFVAVRPSTTTTSPTVSAVVSVDGRRDTLLLERTSSVEAPFGTDVYVGEVDTLGRFGILGWRVISRGAQVQNVVIRCGTAVQKLFP